MAREGTSFVHPPGAAGRFRFDLPRFGMIAQEAEVFTQEQADKICASVSDGDSLRAACAAIGISHATFLLWCNERPALADQYARARATGTDVEFEALQGIHDLEPERGPTGTVDPGWVAWKRLQVDTRKWALSKKAPKKYGDAVTQTHELGDSVKEIVRTIVRAP